MPFLSDKMYQFLKWVAQILLPAVGGLYYGLGKIWGFPEVENVVGTLALLDTFLGALLGISTAAYNKSPDRYDGTIDIQDNLEKGTGVVSIQLDTEPDDLEKKKDAKFKVEKGPDIIDLDNPPPGD